MQILGVLKKKKMKKITQNCEIVYEQIFMWSIGGVYDTFRYTKARYWPVSDSPLV